MDLFSVIGGFALAARMVGQIETVAFCEREAYAQRVLKKHWPDVPICDDIHNLKGNDYGPIDLVTGGYPCQPFSFAGKRRGEDDDRHLWPEMRRVIEECRARWVVCENVVGHISMGLDTVLTDLETIGYTAWPVVIPACAIGAPIISERVWILAEAASGSTQSSGSQCNEWRLQAQVLRKGRHSNHFEAEPCADRVADGIPSRVDRLRGLGNAIVPQVAAALLSKIVEVHFGTVARHNSDYPEHNSGD